MRGFTRELLSLASTPRYPYTAVLTMAKDYTEDDVRNAVFDCHDNGLGVNESAAKYGVPKSTLSD